MIITVTSPDECCEIELPPSPREFCGVPLEMIACIYVGGASAFAGMREVVAEPGPLFARMVQT